MTHLNRRQFLSLSAGSTGAAVFAQCSNHQGRTQNPQSLPSSYQSQEGLLEVDLTASNSPLNLAGQPTSPFSYNQQIPGPRLEANPGDTIRIHFHNQLPQPTNLHYHGLHIPPTGTADNVFLSVPPQETFTYEFTLPENHPAGTFWYHPHRHGYVADQVFAGLAGLFIVRGELDQIPEIQAAQEAFCVLQDFQLTGNGFPHQAIMMGREGDTILINGQTNPTFSLPRQGLLRLRLLNASTSRFYRLSLDNHPFYLLATDGGALAKPQELTELLLTPGERAELLIHGNQDPRAYSLRNLPYNRGGMGMMGGGMMGGGMMSDRRRGRRGRRGQGNTNNTPQVLATLRYSEAETALAVPQRLLAVETLPEPQRVRQFELNHGMMRGQGMIFLINGQPYQGERIDTTVSLNTVEDWEITNTGVMDHPFHLHVNPFQVISRNGQPEPIRAWKDTVLIPRGETVRVRIPFRDFTGKTVYHCHILDHEDLGMMGNLEIRPSAV
ncbi:MAG: multicopper oxidase family protein [Kamptonema sp. SIO4C4]|nr:multicopper oxidase family protein [Kamptonema sp. SIO4C4]